MARTRGSASRSSRAQPQPSAQQLEQLSRLPLAGGETVFYGARGREVARVAPRAGLALLHRHGEAHCLEHEGAAVRAGVKYVLRSDVVFAR